MSELFKQIEEQLKKLVEELERDLIRYEVTELLSISIRLARKLGPLLTWLDFCLEDADCTDALLKLLSEHVRKNPNKYSEYIRKIVQETLHLMTRTEGR